MMGHRRTRQVLGGVAAAALSLAFAGQSAPARLGVSEHDAQQALLRSLQDGRLSSSSAAANAFVALPPAARAALVDAAFAWARVFVTSAAFKAEYLRVRDDDRPQAPTFAGSVDDELTRKDDEQAKSLAQARAMLASLPADERASTEASLQQAEAQWKDPAMVAILRAGIERERSRAQEQYQSDLDTWQQTRPADPLALVAKRLREFLTLSADVDFAATLVGTGTDQRFVNVDYQSKPSDWKMCFRAGKDAVSAARTGAATWLKDLPQ